jgi:DNA repair protein RadC
LAQAADVLDMPLLDHLIVGDQGRYFSFQQAGMLAARMVKGDRA